MQDLDDKINKLNKEQLEAVQTTEGPVLVVAGPGSGKTEILSLRVANILKNREISARNILCLTFTDSAAVNMRKRLSGLLGRDAYKVAIYTFHSFGTEIMGQYPEYFYEGASFVAADKVVQTEVMEKIFEGLEHDNPLRAEHPEKGFVYLNDSLRAIGQLKKAGITPQEFALLIKNNREALEYVNKGISALDARLTAKQLPDILAFVEYLSEYKAESGLPDRNALPLAVGKSLFRAVEFAKEEEQITPVSEWKSDWTKKDDAGNRLFKDSVYVGKLEHLAGIYADYRRQMHALGYYDFDDMLLDVLEVLRANPELGYELQERYQYVLVDEFQDTNDAQMRLLGYLTNAPVHEGRPNIMAVGDDDQAIYKFQGAEISNILEFKKNFIEPKIITLSTNYRSRQEILDLARQIILKGRDRLENKVEGVNKDLVAGSSGLEEGKIVSREFTSSAHEYSYVAEEIAGLIAAGKDPKEIAVIAREHKDLKNLLPYLSEKNIPVEYERQRNVLDEPHILQIIQIARFVSTLGRKSSDEADEYLPEILSYPFWGLERKSVWELSVLANKERVKWIEAMHRYKDDKIKAIADFLLELAAESQYEPVEYILDEIIGSRGASLAENESEEMEQSSEIKHKKFLSPFKQYYFGKEKFEQNKKEYLSFLSALRVFVGALRDHKAGKFLKIDDLVSFVGFHESNNLSITDSSPFSGARDAVQLLSAHKSKGLEFDTVFVLSCLESIWAKGSHGVLLPFPINLPISPAGDTLDDQLRLFYVAVTRAKHNLYLTSFKYSGSGKEALRLSFISENNVGLPDAGEAESLMLPAVSILKEVAEFSAEEGALLKSLTEDYRMSVTHLNNFLNIAEGGPMAFLEQNLLRFPHMKSASGSFGTAMHSAVEMAYLALKREAVLPSVEKLLNWFEAELSKERLSVPDLKLYLARGKAALTKYYSAKAGSMSPRDIIEKNFKDQGVLVGEAHLAGKIDKVVFVNDSEIEVHDFKTGKALEKWEGKDSYEKAKAKNYVRQLIFYKLLVENSRDFGGKYKVGRGVLEFLEPKNGKILDLPLEIKEAEVERVAALIGAVWKKIIDLDFPDTSRYAKDLKGSAEFEEDLLSGKI